MRRLTPEEDFSTMAPSCPRKPRLGLLDWANFGCGLQTWVWISICITICYEAGRIVSFALPPKAFRTTAKRSQLGQSHRLIFVSSFYFSYFFVNMYASTQISRNQSNINLPKQHQTRKSKRSQTSKTQTSQSLNASPASGYFQVDPQRDPQRLRCHATLGEGSEAPATAPRSCGGRGRAAPGRGGELGF